MLHGTYLQRADVVAGSVADSVVRQVRRLRGRRRRRRRRTHIGRRPAARLPTVPRGATHRRTADRGEQSQLVISHFTVTLSQQTCHRSPANITRSPPPAIITRRSGSLLTITDTSHQSRTQSNRRCTPESERHVNRSTRRSSQVCPQFHHPTILHDGTTAGHTTHPPPTHPTEPLLLRRRTPPPPFPSRPQGTRRRPDPTLSVTRPSGGAALITDVSRFPASFSPDRTAAGATAIQTYTRVSRSVGPAGRSWPLPAQTQTPRPCWRGRRRRGRGRRAREVVWRRRVATVTAVYWSFSPLLTAAHSSASHTDNTHKLHRERMQELQDLATHVSSGILHCKIQGLTGHTSTQDTRPYGTHDLK